MIWRDAELMQLVLQQRAPRIRLMPIAFSKSRYEVYLRKITLLQITLFQITRRHVAHYWANLLALGDSHLP